MGERARTEVRLLGPAEIRVVDAGGVSVDRPLHGPRQVELLALLVARRGRSVRRELIEDELWRGEVVSSSAVRVTVARLRRLLGGRVGQELITASGAGYRLEGERLDLDLDRFSRRADEALDSWVADDPARTAHLASEALALWRGDAYDGATELPSVAAERVRLEERRREVGELLSAAQLTVGQVEAALETAVAVTADDPFRERAWVLAMIALHALGRTGAALRAHDDMAATFVRELGVAPGAQADEVRAEIAERQPADALIARLRGPTSAPRGQQMAAPPLAVRLVGRDSERDMVGQLIAGEGAGILVIEAPAGMGKSRLGVDAVERAVAAGMPATLAACPREAGVGQLVLRQLSSGLTEAESATRRGAEASAAVALGLVGDEHGGGPGALVEDDPVTVRLRHYTAMEQLLTSVGDALVVLDDAQWVDNSVAPLVAHLAAVAPRARWIVLARTADRGPAAVELLGDLARVGARWHELPPLSPEESVALVRQHAPALDDELVDLIVAQSAGTPLLIGEMAQHLARGGDPGAVPAGIEAVVTAEVQRMGDEAASVASALAVAGDPHPLSAVTAAAGLDGAAARRAVAALVAVGVAETDARRATVWPRHDLLRRALLHPLADHEVGDTHRRLAAALASSPDGDPKLVLRHLLADPHSDPDDIERAAAKALDDPHLYGAPDEVAALGRRLLDRAGPTGRTPDAVATRLRIASAMFAIGDPGAGKRLVDAQTATLELLADPTLDALSYLVRTSVARHDDIDLEEIDAAEAVLERLPSSATELRVGLASWIGHAAEHAQDRERARRLADRASHSLTMAEGQVSTLPLEAIITTLRVRCAMAFEAPPGELDQLVDRLVTEAEATRDPTTRAAARLAQVEQAMRTGTVGDVARAVAQAGDLDTPVQRVETRWFIAAVRAAHDLMRGDLVAAETSYLAALSTGAAHGVGLALPAALAHRFVIDWECGRFGVFAALLPPAEDEPTVPRVLGQVYAHLAVGDDDRAAEVAGLMAHPGVIASGGAAWGFVAALGGDAAQRLGHVSLGQAIASDLEGRPDEALTSAGMCYSGPVSLARGLALAGAGELTAALDDLSAAVERERRVGAPITLARAAEGRSAVLLRRGRPGDRAEAERMTRVADEARRSVLLPSAKA